MVKPRVYVSVVLWIIFHGYFFGANAGRTYDGYEIEELTFNNTDSPMDPKNKLLFVHVIYRHGDRNILMPYKNDPWYRDEYWPGGFAQLTNLGKQQQYQLGKWLKKRYSSLLSKYYDREQIYVQSTDVDRALMSALANLAGLYKPKSDENWSDCIQWQPIPVHTTPNYEDIIFGKANCAVYQKLFLEFKNSQVFQDIQDRYQHFYEYLQEMTGETVGEPYDVQLINNTLFIESLYNKTLPEWTKKVYGGHDMIYLSNFAFTIATYTRQMARLKTGPLINEILQRFKDKLKLNLEPDRSVWIYSGHDTTITNVLNTLKLFDPPHSPPYAACIMLELRIDRHENPFVSIFYKNTTDEPKAMEIPGCGTVCPLQKMFNLYKDILPVNWEDECKIQKTPTTTTTTKAPRNRKIIVEKDDHVDIDEIINGKPVKIGEWPKGVDRRYGEVKTGKLIRTSDAAKGHSSYAPETVKFIFLIAIIALFAYGVVIYYRKPNWKEYFQIL